MQQQCKLRFIASHEFISVKIRGISTDESTKMASASVSSRRAVVYY